MLKKLNPLYNRLWSLHPWEGLSIGKSEESNYPLQRVNWRLNEGLSKKVFSRISCSRILKQIIQLVAFFLFLKIHFYIYIHDWNHVENCCERLHIGQVYVFEGQLELAGLHCCNTCVSLVYLFFWGLYILKK